MLGQIKGKQILSAVVSFAIIGGILLSIPMRSNAMLSQEFKAESQRFNPEDFNSYANSDLIENYKNEEFYSYSDKISAKMKERFDVVHKKIVTEEIQIEEEVLETNSFHFLKTIHNENLQSIINKSLKEYLNKINSITTIKEYNKLVQDLDEKGFFMWSCAREVPKQNLAEIKKY